MQTMQMFKYIFDEMETPFLASVNSLVTAFMSYAAVPLQVALVLYLALTGVLVMTGRSSLTVGDLAGWAIKFSIVAWFATNGSVYATWVQNFFLTVLPNDIIAVVSNSGGGASIDANAFDTAWTHAYEAGQRVNEHLSTFDIGEQIFVYLYWLVAMFSCIIAFAIWLLSHIILGLFIIIGPLMIGLVLFSATKPIFERWIGSMISCVILQVVVVILVTLTLKVEGLIIAQILASRGPNTAEQIRILLGAMIFFIFSAMVALQLPGFATALAGGLHFHGQAIFRGVQAGTSRAGRTLRAGAQAADAGIDRGVTALRRRMGPSAGSSMSKSRKEE